MPTTPAEVCRCGHEKAAHEHYRAGTECSICEPGGCGGYVRAGGLKAKLAATIERVQGHGDI